MKPSRQEKVCRLLQKELGEIFLLFARRQQGVLITVSEVRVTPDLSLARTFLSIFPTEKQQEVMKLVEENAKNLSFELGNRMRNQLRVVPELEFKLDESLDRLEHIDELLNQ